MCQRFGIDVSHWQGDFNFANAKNNEGVEFAIIKAGGGDDGLYKDSRFEDNYRKCVECGLPKGAYFYGNAKSVADAKKEAEYFISILSGKKYEYPVFYDVEGKMITDINVNIKMYIFDHLRMYKFAHSSSCIIYSLKRYDFPVMFMTCA